ncbi:MAG TPA: MMPL family transporter, partial [Sphingobacteriaceae bacterium]
MWEKLSKFILSNRFPILIIFFLVTVFMAFKASQVRLSFSGSKVLPVTDSAFIKYNAFKEKFGEDGSIMVLGVQSPDLLHKKEVYNSWGVLTDEIQKLKGVQQVLSVSKLFQLKKDTVNKKFIIEPLVKGQVQSVSEMDSVRQEIYNVRFFDGLIFNKKTHASLLAITFDNKVLNSKERIPIINSIVEKAEEFSKKSNLTVHYSGLPFIRTAVSELVSREFVLFLGLSILVAAIILLIFFRSFYQVIFPVLLVIIGVIWSLGFLVLFNYEITMLTGLIPPLMVIIGIPNSILLLNKYQNELRKGASKADALSITVQRMAETTMIANITAAI